MVSGHPSEILLRRAEDTPVKYATLSLREFHGARKAGQGEKRKEEIGDRNLGI